MVPQSRFERHLETGSWLLKPKPVIFIKKLLSTFYFFVGGLTYLKVENSDKLVSVLLQIQITEGTESTGLHGHPYQKGLRVPQTVVPVRNTLGIRRIFRRAFTYKQSEYEVKYWDTGMVHVLVLSILYNCNRQIVPRTFCLFVIFTSVRVS